MRVSVSLTPSALTKDGTGKSSSRVLDFRGIDDLLQLVLYPDPYERASERIEVTMDYRTAFWVAEELAAKIQEKKK